MFTLYKVKYIIYIIYNHCFAQAYCSNSFTFWCSAIALHCFCQKRTLLPCTRRWTLVRVRVTNQAWRIYAIVLMPGMGQWLLCHVAPGAKQLMKTPAAPDLRWRQPVCSTLLQSLMCLLLRHHLLRKLNAVAVMALTLGSTKLCVRSANAGCP